VNEPSVNDARALERVRERRARELERLIVATPRLTGFRDYLRGVLDELAALQPIVPERSQPVVEDAQRAARRLFSDLGAVRDEVGRVRAMRRPGLDDQA
jgi:hypothetical protein